MPRKGERTPLTTRTKQAAARAPQPALERVLARSEPAGACLVWTGHRNRDGYGRIGIGSRTDGTRRLESVHVVVWEAAHGPVAPGLEVCHHCDNPACVRLDHLFTGTHAENIRDMRDKGRKLTKLTLADVERIRSGGEPIQVLARELGVSPSTVHRHRWKN